MATAEAQDLENSRPMFYRVVKYGIRQQYVPGGREAGCECWKRNSFPNRIVGAIERERNWLEHDFATCKAKLIQTELKLVETEQALGQSQKEVIEIKGQWNAQNEQTRYVTELMEHYSKQNDQLLARVRDDNMVIQGLRVELHEALAASRQGSFVEATVSAQRVEETTGATRETQMRQRSNMDRRMRLGKNSPNTAFRNNQVQEVIPIPSLRRLGPSRNPNLTMPGVKCNFCKKMGHDEKNCWRKTNKCLICGSSDHRVSQCPRKLGLGTTQPTTPLLKRKVGDGDTSQNKPKLPARVLAIGNTEVPFHPTNQTEGTFLLLGQLVKILITSDFTYSFTNIEILGNSKA